MADIRVTCPMCKTQLEIDSEYEGQEVECGTCLQVFTATTKKSKDAGSSDGGSKVKGSTKTRSSRDRDDDDDDDDRPRRSRRDDDDDDDDEYYDRPRRRSGGSNGLAIASLVLGITSFLPGCCCIFLLVPLSIGAIITGALGMKQENGKGMAIAGLILGICALALGIVAVIFNLAGGGGMQNNPGGRFR